MCGKKFTIVLPLVIAVTAFVVMVSMFEGFGIEKWLVPLYWFLVTIYWLRRASEG